MRAVKKGILIMTNESMERILDIVQRHVDDLKKSSKMQRLLEIIESAAAEGRKILIFSLFFRRPIHFRIGILFFFLKQFRIGILVTTIIHALHRIFN